MKEMLVMEKMYFIKYETRLCAQRTVDTEMDSSFIWVVAVENLKNERYKRVRLAIIAVSIHFVSLTP